MLNRHRNQFVNDFFQELSRLRYVALRMVAPVNQFNDEELKILLDSKQYTRLLEIISSSDNIKSITLLEKPFSADVTINFFDHTSLRINIITSFVRKGIRFMDEQKVLSTSITNADGVKVPQPCYNFEYIVLSHLLNGVNVSENYRQHFADYSKEDRTKIFAHMRERYAFEINVLEDLFRFEEKTYNIIRRKLHKLKENSFFKRFLRDMQYIPYFVINLYSRHRIKITFKSEVHPQMKRASSAA
jgi:hypothetical protein